MATGGRTSGKAASVSTIAFPRHVFRASSHAMPTPGGRIRRGASLAVQSKRPMISLLSKHLSLGRSDAVLSRTSNCAFSLNSTVLE